MSRHVQAHHHSANPSKSPEPFQLLSACIQLRINYMNVLSSPVSEFWQDRLIASKHVLHLYKMFAALPVAQRLCKEYKHIETYVMSLKDLKYFHRKHMDWY